MTDPGPEGKEDGARIRLAGVAVIIPALNEEESLPGLLDALPAGLGAVVVVDNASTDRTADVASNHGAQVVSELERGYGAACLAGLSALESLNAPPDVIVFLDADHAMGPVQIPDLVRPILDDEADLTLGTRTADPAHGGSVLVHARAGNRLVLTLVRLLFGYQYSDMAPFRAIRTQSLSVLDMDDRNWGWTLQMQIRAVRRQLRIREVPFVHRPRSAGKSKISGSVIGTFKVGSKMFFTLARERLMR